MGGTPPEQLDSARIGSSILFPAYNVRFHVGKAEKLYGAERFRY